MAVDRFSKRVAESRPFGFDFAGDLDASVGETLTAATFTITAPDGGDADPSAMKSGAATASGSQCRQRLVGGVAGVLYRLSVVATTSAGNTLAAAAPLKVEI